MDRASLTSYHFDLVIHSYLLTSHSQSVDEKKNRLFRSAKIKSTRRKIYSISNFQFRLRLVGAAQRNTSTVLTKREELFSVQHIDLYTFFHSIRKIREIVEHHQNGDVNFIEMQLSHAAIHSSLVTRIF
ncbi:hypothetical protein LOAG_02283 [Loa loa]|uniref:Uncharacterized protein n=1 Tax=Loa loa TaxID=7209 RepID=A0A1S0U716_LOALO|nr:hypothetical protein LOAG_02283 [Loa loa]EFO26198.1 hypothetical protein LOAG_02283 [Loa loa]